jgi:hypothetical protein
MRDTETNTYQKSVAQGQCSSLIRQHLLSDNVEFGLVVVNFEVVCLCLDVLLICLKVKPF